jgi:hypothetical protein
LARRSRSTTAHSTAQQQHILQLHGPVPESPRRDCNLILVETVIREDSPALESAPEPGSITPGELSVYVPFNVVV